MGNVDKRLEELNAQIDVWDKAGDYTELLPLITECLELTGVKYGTRSAEYAAALNDLGGVYRDIGLYADSERLFLDGNEILAELYGDNDPNYATSLLNTAGLYRLMKRYKEAERFFVDVISIYKEVLNEDHFLMTSAMNNLGLLYQDQGEYDKARVLFDRCVTALEKAGDNPIALGSTFNNLATLCQLQHNLDDSLKYLQRALALHRENVGVDHPLYATALNTYGMYQLSSGDRAGAEETLTEVERITRKRFGEGSSYHTMAAANLEYVKRAADEGT